MKDNMLTASDGNNKKVSELMMGRGVFLKHVHQYLSRCLGHDNSIDTIKYLNKVNKWTRK